MQRVVWFCVLIVHTLGGLGVTQVVEKKVSQGKGRAALAGAISVDEARQLALESARAALVETGCGVEVSAATFVRNGVLSADFISALSHGMIVREKLVVEKAFPVQPGKSLEQMLEVEIEGEVACPQGEPDPDFTLNMTLNQTTFRNGEAMELRLTPSQDSYLTVLNLAADGQVYLLLLSFFQREIRVAANQTLLLPGEQQRRDGARLKIFLDPELHHVGTPALALQEVARWLVRIPLAKRTGTVMQYDIRE